MHRRSFIQNSALAFGALSLDHRQILSAMFDDPWKIRMLTDDIGIFTEKGGTIAFYLAKKGTVVVDAQFPEQAGHLIAEVKKRTTHPFEMLINTHHHGDHTAGNVAFKDVLTRVRAHENSLKNQKNVAVAQKSEDKQLYPNETYADTVCEKINNERICLYYFGAGHTDGDSFVHFENANIVHAGDLVFNRRHPFVDRSAGANMKSWIEVLNKAVKKFDKKTQYICGHSAEGYEVTATSADLDAFAEYLGKILQFADQEMKVGKTKEEFLKNTTLPFETTWKGDGLQRPLEAAWDELTSKQ